MSQSEAESRQKQQSFYYAKLTASAPSGRAYLGVKLL